MAIQALDKQIPKKVHIEYDDEFVCPACGKTTEDYDVTILKFCPECGQKLRWD
jgi:membrane protease subunit (stomatin/prohibitin family)